MDFAVEIKNSGRLEKPEPCAVCGKPTKEWVEYFYPANVCVKESCLEFLADEYVEEMQDGYRNRHKVAADHHWNLQNHK